MKTTNLGIVYSNAFDKVVETFACNPEIDRVLVGMRVPDSWITAMPDRTGYIIRICLFFDGVSNIRVPGVAHLKVNNSKVPFKSHSVSGFTEVDLEDVYMPNNSWEVVVETTVGRAQFTESSIIRGYFDRARGPFGRSSPLDTAPPEEVVPSEPTAESSRKRIFNSILKDLNQKFGACTGIAHTETITVKPDSPTTQELQKFLVDNGYHCHQEISICGPNGASKIVVYL